MRKSRDHDFREIGFARGRGSEARSVTGGVHDGFDYGRSGVAEDLRSPRADVVDQLVTIGVPQMGALAANDEWGIAANGAKCAHGRVDTPRNQLLSARLQLTRNIGFAGHSAPSNNAPI